jgi:hypothetical protein
VLGNLIQGQAVIQPARGRSSAGFIQAQRIPKSLFGQTRFVAPLTQAFRHSVFGEGSATRALIAASWFLRLDML